MSQPADTNLNIARNEQPELGELSPALAARLRALTPARIGLRRTGTSLATSELLDFQLSHGRARDAVHAPLQPGSLLAELRALPEFQKYGEPMLLHSAAANRQSYLQRPDLGRKLDEASLLKLEQHKTAAVRDVQSAMLDAQCAIYDVQVAIVDGLSALAVERHAIPVLSALMELIAQWSPTLRLAPVCVVEQGRVAVGDAVAKAMSASLVIVLIGERPGLSSPDSLGAYITWNPQPGQTTDAERNCISNIRTEGLSYAQAAGRLLFYMQQAMEKRVTGVALKDPDSEMPPAELKSGEPHD